MWRTWRATVTVLARRSMSAHCSPATSPRRSPSSATRWNNTYIGCSLRRSQAPSTTEIRHLFNLIGKDDQAIGHEEATSGDASDSGYQRPSPVVQGAVSSKFRASFGATMCWASAATSCAGRRRQRDRRGAPGPRRPSGPSCRRSDLGRPDRCAGVAVGQRQELSGALGRHDRDPFKKVGEGSVESLLVQHPNYRPPRAVQRRVLDVAPDTMSATVGCPVQHVVVTALRDAMSASN